MEGVQDGMMAMLRLAALLAFGTVVQGPLQRMLYHPLHWPHRSCTRGMLEREKWSEPGDGWAGKVG